MGELDKERKKFSLHQPWSSDDSPCFGCPLREAREANRVVGYEFVGEGPHRLVFIGEAPGNEEIRLGRPFIGPSGRLLRDALKSLGIESYILANAVMCAPHKPEASPEPPPEEAVLRCRNHLIRFLRSLGNGVERVFLLGKTAIESLLPELDKDFVKLSRVSQYSGKYWGTEFTLGNSPFKVYPTNHPSFVVRKGGQGSPVYEDFLSSLRSATEENEELPEDLAKDKPVSFKALLRSGSLPAKPRGRLNYQVFTLDDFEKGFELISELKEVSFDVETSGVAEVSSRRNLLYIGLGNHELQVGFDLRKGDSKKIPKFLLALYKFLNEPSRRVIVFNQSYESGVYFQCFGEWRTFWDVFSMVKAIGLPKGLKDSAHDVFGCEVWSEGVMSYVHLVEAIVQKPDVFEALVYTGEHSLKPRDRERALKALEASGMSRESVREILKELGTRGFKEGVGWELVPTEILAHYNALDVLWTHELYLFLLPLQREEIWEIYQKQEALSSLMNLVGIAYDKKRAEELKVEVSRMARDALLNLLSVPKMKEAVIRKKLEETRIKDVKELNEFFRNLHRKDLSYMRKMPVEGMESALEARKKAYYEFMESSILSPSGSHPEFLSHYQKRYHEILRRVREELEEALHQDLLFAREEEPEVAISRLTKWFNPSSSKRYFPVFHQAMSHPKLQVAAFLNSLVQGQGEDFVRTLSQSFGSLKDWVSRWDEVSRTLFHEYDPSQIKQLIAKVWATFSDGLKDEYIESLYILFKDYIGEDLSDYPECLNRMDEGIAQSAQMLLHFRVYKKCIKVLDAFLSGRMGEGLVYKANEMVVWNKIPVPVEDPNGNKDYYRTEFLANFTDTRRWSSRFHTIPTGTEVRECYVSRWGDEGVWVHFDYSQMELRVLAAISGDENMMKAFESGADIHRYVASRIYGVPPEQVSSHQRRTAKGASFSLVYGQSPAGLAIQYLNGNVAEAEKMFESFFQEFPKVKEFISLYHAYANKHGHVKNLFGDYLDVMREQPDWRRRAQNYPIQSTSSSVSALTGWSIWETSRRLGLLAVPVAFVHDAMDFDVHILHLVPFLKVVNNLARSVPRRYGIPADIEVSIGTSLYCGLTIEMEDEENYVIRGESRVYEELMRRLSNFYEVEEESKEESSSFIPISEIFAQKRVISLSMGKEVKTLEARIRIRPSKQNEHPSHRE